jgi:anti-anti-sigma factor
MSSYVYEFPVWKEQNILLLTLPFKSLDSSTNLGFRDAIRSNIFNSSQPYIIVDLSKLEYIDETGIAAIYHTWGECSNHNQNLILCGLNNTILKKLQEKRLDSFVDITENYNEALTLVEEYTKVKKNYQEKSLNLENFFGNLFEESFIHPISVTAPKPEVDNGTVPFKPRPESKHGSVSSIKMTEKPAIYNLDFSQQHMLHPSTTRVILIEEEQHVIESFKQLFKTNSFKLSIFNKSLDAIEHINQHGVDIVITAIAGEHIDGISTCLALKQKQHHVNVMLLSNSSDNTVKDKAYAAGADSFITKPLNQNEIQAKIKSTDRIIRTLKSLYSKNIKLERMVVTDPLTKLYNRRYFQTQLIKEMNRGKRYKDTQALMLIDIDYFKSINDTHGHTVGDEVLKRVSSLLLTSLRKSDIACRYGGEEFAVIIPETTPEKAFIVAEKIRKVFEKTTFIISGTKLNITVSTGIALKFPDIDISITELIEMADKALYTAKNEGRNRTIIYNLKRKYFDKHKAN